MPERSAVLTPSTPATAAATPIRSGRRPSVAAFHGSERKGRGEQTLLFVFIVVPFLAVVAAVPITWGWGLAWRDLVIAFVFYMVSGLGITVGYHRYLTHGSFKARRGLRVALAMAGSLAIEGPCIRWVSDHRKHHKFSDAEGDPHSPWRYGDDARALVKGLWHAHIGWLFDPEQTSAQKYAPDLLADRDILRVSKAFPWLAAFSLLAPALVGGLWSWSLTGAATAFLWASLIRVCLLHHVTWSINSICHTVGERPFATRDRSRNVWWLAVLSFGESWHNLHHADPTAARHGVLRGQLDSSARVIRWFERLGWASDVRWPTERRLAARRAA